MSEHTVFAAIEAARREGRSVALCTVIGVKGSTPRSGAAKMVVREDGTIVGTIGGGAIEYEVIAEAKRVMAAGVPRLYRANLAADHGMCCGGEMEVFIDPVVSPFAVHLQGAGHVALALAPRLVELGFEVSIHDSRDELLTEERFPGCNLVEGEPTSTLPSSSSRAAVVVFTHSHDLDLTLMERLLEMEHGYLGLIGSMNKVRRFRVRLEAAGFSPELWDRVHAPIGLDIGSETPAEIAISIAAELIQWRAEVRSQAV